MTFVVGTVLELSRGSPSCPHLLQYFHHHHHHHHEEQGSSVGIAMRHGLDSRGISVRFPAWAKDFSFLHRGKTDSDTHQSSYPMGTEGSFLGQKVVGM
jgi:hypothetical protein